MFGSKSVVDLLVRGGKIEIAVALNGDFAVNSAFGFCDLLFDSAQAASGPIIGVLEVGHRIRGCVFARIACRGLCPDLAVGVGFTRDFPPPGFNHLRHGGVSPTKCSADLHLSMLACSEATPAAWAAHNKDRDKLQDISREMLGSDLDVVMAAGHPFYDNDHQKVDTPDYSFMYEEDYAKLSAGETDWNYFESNDDFKKMAEGDVKPDQKYWGIAQVGSTLQNSRSGEAKEPYSDPLNDVVDLPTMTTGALNALGQDEDGFSVMIEGGAIDWAGHGNNPVRDIEETQDFNKSVDAAIKWVEENSSWEETLLVVTADHETGYLSGANEAPTEDNPEADNRFNAMEGEKGKVARHGWYSGQHTNQLVPFFFKGAGSEDIMARTSGTDSVRGDYIDNTLVANLTFDEWWNDGTGQAEEPEQPEDAANPSDDADAGKEGSSKGFAAGLATGLGILGAVVGASAS